MVMMIYRKCAKQLRKVCIIWNSNFSYKLSQLNLRIACSQNGTIGNVKIWTLKWT